MNRTINPTASRDGLPLGVSVARLAVLFDLDGVLTDTAELHFQSWRQLATGLDLPFDRAANEPLRGLGRAESLKLLLGARFNTFTAQQQQAMMDRKNAAYLERVAQMTPQDLLPGAEPLLAALHAQGVPMAVASSSRNARAVLTRLGITHLLQAVVDGNDAPRSKPDPQVFLLAAERLRTAPRECVVVEDAESGVAAGLAAGMRVIGIGPQARVGHAHKVFPQIADLSADHVLHGW